MRRLIFVSLLSALVLLTSCEHEYAAQDVAMRIYIEMPMNMDNPVLTQASALLTNIETGDTYEVTDFSADGATYTATVVVPEGRYNVVATGTVSYDIEGNAVVTVMRAESNGVDVSSAHAANAMVRMLFNNYNAEEGFVIEEVFFSSNTYPSTQRPYTDDQYMLITNNSDHLLYADSLAIVESKFQPDMQWELTPDLMKEAVSVSWVFLIPGNGKSVPVEPGESLLLAFNGKNHTLINSNSFDLSGADFEFYDVSPNTEFVDEDNPDVPNLIKWYSDMWSYTVLHNKGDKSYGLVRMRVDMDTFLRDYYYKYTYVVNASWGTYDGKGDAYFIPNSWVIDMVNLSIKSDWAWNVVSPSLDAGWTYCAETFSDKTRYGLSVIRKRNSDGKLVDTNNSSNDFLPRQVPSMKARQE